MPQTLAQMVKAKYPGVYDDISDAELEAKVIAKYPGVYDDLPRTPSVGVMVQGQPMPIEQYNETQQGRLTPEEAAGMRATAVPQPPGMGLEMGMAKGAARTMIGAAQLASKGARAIGLGNYVPSDETFQKARDYTTAATPEQKVGQAIEQGAEFFAPGSALGKAKAATQTGVKVLDTLLGAALEGASAAGVSSVQQGTTEGAGKTAALNAGVNLGAQATLPLGGWLAKRIESALIKPTTADVANGFKVENVYAYNLGGSLSESYDKTVKKLGELSTQLKAALQKAPPGQGAADVDVLGAIAETADEFAKGSSKTFGQNEAINRAVENLLNDPLFQTAAKTGTVDVATANEIKQAVGDLGAWLHDPSGRVMVDPDSKAMEQVANKLYAKLKTAIEQKAVGDVRAINRQFSDILPIRQAIIRRIPIEQRQNVLNMGDLLSFANGGWALALANRVLKSGQAANAFNTASREAGTTAATAGRATSALTAPAGRR